MPRLPFPAYLDHLRAESQRFRAVLAECDPAAPVPSCPQWSAADLLWHLCEVQHWWSWIVVNRPAGPDGYPEPTRPTEHAALLARYDEQYTGLVDALAAADPSEPAWTWHPTLKDVAFIYRRQAHEALVHRRDAELAAGTLTPFPADLAADGVDEVLDVMFGGCPPWGTFTPGPQHVRFDLTDTGDQVWVRLGRFHGTAPDGVTHDEDDLSAVPDPGVPPDATVTGTAEALDTALWRRADWSALSVDGAPDAVDAVRKITDQPIT